MFLAKALAPMDWIMVVAWVLIFVITLIIELETLNLTTIWFCISSVVALICGIFFANPLLQIGIFVGLSMLLVFLTKPLTKKMMLTSVIRTNTNRFIGEVAVVVKAFSASEIGEVKIENELWRAVSDDELEFTAGEKVIVDAISGNKLVVSKTTPKIL